MFITQNSSHCFIYIQPTKEGYAVRYGIGTGSSCRYLFKEYKILTLTPVFIFEVLSYIKQNTDLSTTQIFMNITQDEKEIYTSSLAILKLLEKSVINMGKNCIIGYLVQSEN